MFENLFGLNIICYQQPKCDISKIAVTVRINI